MPSVAIGYKATTGFVTDNTINDGDFNTGPSQSAPRSSNTSLNYTARYDLGTARTVKFFSFYVTYHDYVSIEFEYSTDNITWIVPADENGRDTSYAGGMSGSTVSATIKLQLDTITARYFRVTVSAGNSGVTIGTFDVSLKEFRLYDLNQNRVDETYVATPQPAPANFRVSSFSDRSITVNWDNNALITNYEVYVNDKYSLGLGAGAVQGTLEFVGPIDETTRFQPSTTYNFKIRGQEGGDWSPYSPTIQGTTTADTTPPGAPTGLTVSSVGHQKVGLTWTRPDPYPVDMKEYRIMQDNVEVARTANTSFTFTNLTNGVTYTFGVNAIDTTGNISVGSNTVTATPVGDTAPPAVPTITSAVAGNAKVTVKHSTVADADLAGYRIFRDGVQVAQGNFSVNGFSDTGLVNGTTYSYTVASYDTTGNQSAQSAAVTATPIIMTGTPLAPTNVEAILSRTYGHIVEPKVLVTWDLPTGHNSNRWHIKRRPAGGIWETIAISTDSTNLLYNDTTFVYDTTYEYTVQSENDVDFSTDGNIATVTPTKNGVNVDMDKTGDIWYEYSSENRIVADDFLAVPVAFADAGDIYPKPLTVVATYEFPYLVYPESIQVNFAYRFRVNVKIGTKTSIFQPHPNNLAVSGSNEADGSRTFGGVQSSSLSDTTNATVYRPDRYEGIEAITVTFTSVNTLPLGTVGGFNHIRPYYIRLFNKRNYDHTIYTLPLTPTVENVFALQRNGGIEVYWDLLTSLGYDVNYNVYRSLQPNGPYTRIGSESSSLVMQGRYLDTKVQRGVRYYYRVNAEAIPGSDPYIIYPVGEGRWSNEGSAMAGGAITPSVASQGNVMVF